METNEVTMHTSRKHPVGTFLRVSRWLAVAMLSGLVIAGLYVQAPWKVIVLCAVMLAGLTIIYGRLRIIFWLGFAAAAIGVGVWILIPETDDGRWQRWPLEEEVAAFNACFAIPPEDNAATVYKALLEARDWDEISERLKDADPESNGQAGLWHDDDLPDLAVLLAELAMELEILHIAAKKETCFFETDPSVYATGDQVDILGIFKRWLNVLNMRSRQHSNPHQIDDAIVMTLMGRQLCGQPTVMDMLVGLGIRGTGIRRLKEIIVNQPLGEEQLEKIEWSIKQGKFDIERIWRGIIDHEKLSSKDIVALMYQIHPSGKVRSVRVSHMLKGLDIDEADLMPTTYWMSVLERWTAVIMWFVMPSTPEPLFHTIDLAYEPLYTFPPPEDLRLNFAYYPFKLHWNIEGYVADGTNHTQSLMSELVHNILAQQECKRRGGLLLCELRRYKERHQRWPESLEELLPDAPEERLVDPVSGERFMYQRSGDGFVLYSTGMETWGFDPNDLSRTKEHKVIEVWPTK